MARLPDHDALINIYEHLPNLPRASDALTMLRRIASLVKPVMRKRSWRVGTLTEFYPQNEQNLLGLNVNRGQRICLRLRFPSDNSLFKPLEEVVDTMLHELAHNVFGPHDAKFHALWNELRDEYMDLKMKGYSGEGFLGNGQRLGGRGVPMTEMRRQARAEAERRRGVQALAAGSGQKLGGTPVLRGVDMRAVIADAVERRSRITKGCGSGTQEGDRAAEQAGRDSYKTHGFKTQKEEDEANQKAIEEALWELVQQEEDKKQGLEPEVWVARDVGKGPAAQGSSSAASSKPRSKASSSSSRKPTPTTSRSSTPIASTSASSKSKLPSAPSFKNRDYNVLRPRIGDTHTSNLVPEEEQRQRERERINGHVDLTSLSPSPPPPARRYPKNINSTNGIKREPKPGCEDYAPPPGPPADGRSPSHHVVKHEPTPTHQRPSQTSIQQHPQYPSHPPPQPQTWSCKTCTLVNPTTYLVCDACGTERPLSSMLPPNDSAVGPETMGAASKAAPGAVAGFDIGDYDLGGIDLDVNPASWHLGSRAVAQRTTLPSGHAQAPASKQGDKTKALGWKCTRCGTFMESCWWTCSFCGGMKMSS